MIETIYSLETNEEQVIKLPKNIHQIGSGETKYHIYIEDKVSEFLQLLPENEKNIRYGVLLGNIKFSGNEMYLFIRAVVEIREILDNTLLFGDDVWTGIYEDIRKYYHGEKIVGWYHSAENFHERELFHMRKLHLDHFAGNDKIFLNIDREESELDFYVYFNGDLQKVKCYHIYYEKNVDLENYIFDTHYHLTSKRKTIQTKAQIIPSEQKEKIIEQSEEISQNSEQDAQPKDELMRMPDATAYKKLMTFSTKAASAVAIVALLFTVGIMYKKGQLENLQVEMQEVVANIMNKGDESQFITTIPSQETTPPESEEESQSQETQEQETPVSTIQEQETTEMTETEEQIQETQPQETQETTPTETAAVLPAETRRYEVQKGDTLYGICKKLYGNTDNLEIIMRLNNLDSPDSITYGKTLIIP